MLAPELVYIDGTIPAPKIIIESVATCFRCSVQVRSDGSYLDRTPHEAREIPTELFNKRAKWITDRISQARNYRRLAVGSGSYEAAYAREKEKQRDQLAEIALGKKSELDATYPELLLPEEELLEEIISRIGVAQVAAIDTYGREIYQDHPTNAETELPVCNDLLDKFLTKTRLRQANGSGSGLSKTKSCWEGTRMHFRLILAQNPNGFGWSKLADLAVCRSSLKGLMCLGEKQCLSAGLDAGPYFSASSIDESWNRILKEFLRSNAPIQALGTVTALEFGTKRDATPLPAWFTHPDQNEPLDACLHEILNHIPSLEPKTNVMAVPDELHSLARSWKNGQFNFGEFVRYALLPIRTRDFDGSSDIPKY